MEIRRLGIVGGGSTGIAIAEGAASAGIEVIVAGITEERARTAREELIGSLDRELRKWGITEAERRVILSRVRFATGMEPLREAPLVIESVPEEMGRKREVMRRLGEICPPDRILVTSTSMLGITEIAAASGRPDRVIGMHFLHPVTTNPIVELFRGRETSDETFAAAAGLARALGKRVIEVSERPGYVATRAILPLLNEAMEIVMEGIATAEDVDAALRLGYQLPTGPLEYCDRIGLEKVKAWMDHLSRELGDSRFGPCPLLRDLVEAGHLGAATGRGFHAYDGSRRRLPAGKEGSA